MKPVVRETWHQGEKESHLWTTSLHLLKKKQNILIIGNPTLVFEYEKSMDLVETNFRYLNERNYFRKKYLTGVTKM